MRNLSAVIEFLESERKAIFVARVFHSDEFGTHSSTEEDARPYEDAAEALRDIRSLICEEVPE